MKSPVLGHRPAPAKLLAGLLILAIVLGLAPLAGFSNVAARANETLPIQTEDPAPPNIAHAVDLAFVVPLSVPPAPSGLLTDEMLEEHLADESALNQLLRLAMNQNLSIAVDPYLLHSLIAANSEPANEFLNTLRLSSADKFLMSYANTPVAYLENISDYPDILSGSLQQLQLLELEHPLLDSLAASIWSPNALMNPTVLDSVPQNVDRIMLSEQQRHTETELAEIEQEVSDYIPQENLENLRIFYSHSQANGALNKYLDSGFEMDYESFIRLIRFELPAVESSLVLTPTFSERLPETLERLTTQFNVNLIPLTSLPVSLKSHPSIDPALESLDHDEQLIADVNSVISTDNSVRNFLTALGSPEMASAQYRLFALQALSQNYTDVERADALLAYLTAATGLQQSITIEPGSDITLITEESSFGVSVNNSLVSPAEVVIRFHASNNRLIIPETVAVTVDGNSIQTVTVPVSAIANGSVVLSMTLFSKNGVQLGGAQQLQVQIQAQVELVAMIIFGILVVGFITAGVIRSLPSRRAKRAASGTRSATPLDPDTSRDEVNNV